MFLILVASLTVGQAPMPAPSAQDIQSRALDARQQIRSMRLSIDVRQTAYADGKPGKETSRRVTTWLSGKRIRSDVVRSGGAFANFRIVDCLHCDKEGWGIEVIDKPGVASEIFRLEQPNAPELRDAIDPRLVGYYPNIFAILRESRLDSYVGGTNRTPPEVSLARLDGVDCWLLKWPSNKDVWSSSVWVSPSQGWNVVKIELRSPPETQQLDTRSVTSELAQSPSSRLWFPSRVVFESRVGGELKEREVLTISDVRINEDIPPEVFTLPGIQLRERAYIQNRADPKKSGFWQPATQTTTRPLPPIATAPAEAATPVNPPASPNYWLLAVCVLAAVGAVAVLVLRRRSAVG
ncbi:MAG: hypothetical protein K2V38_28220 [Gemmataceae bacterium]|nr:hypothetical protein [Gemmataceae bacterium]